MSSNSNIPYTAPEIVGEKQQRTDVFFPTAAALDSSLIKLNNAAIKAPLIDKRFLTFPEPWSRWGSNNLHPDILMGYVKKCGLLARAIDTLSSYTIGNGIFFYTISNGMVVEADIKWLQLWKRSNGIKWLYRSAIDYWTFGNVFTKIIMDSSSTKKKPLLLIPESAVFCRWKKQDINTRRIETCYISNQWDTIMGMNGSDINPDDYMDKVPVLDPFLYSLQLANTNESKFIIGIDNYTPGNFYYHTLPWHSDDILKYVEILNQIPSITQSVFENSLSANNQFIIDEDYLASRLGYRDRTDNAFLSCAPEKRMAMIQTIKSEIQNNLTGRASENKTIVTLKHYDKQGKEYSSIDIKALENKSATSADIPSSQNASGKIIEAFGLDPAMLGSVMSDTKSRGGGSDKDSAVNALQIWLQPHRANLLSTAEIFMRQIGLPDDIHIGIRDIQTYSVDPMQQGRILENNNQ